MTLNFCFSVYLYMKIFLPTFVYFFFNVNMTIVSLTFHNVFVCTPRVKLELPNPFRLPDLSIDSRTIKVVEETYRLRISR